MVSSNEPESDFLKFLESPVEAEYAQSQVATTVRDASVQLKQKPCIIVLIQFLLKFSGLAQILKTITSDANDRPKAGNNLAKFLGER